MVSGNGTTIDNRKLRDSSSKLIFGDNILSSQFFRDYGDVEILRNIRPEDVEDVSERYIPLYSTERESDTVKKVNITKYVHPEEGKNPLNIPLYIISLVEHKTKVEYNVIMQILRYMIHIWENYEKDMERECPGISRKKGFLYPPVLPIVYYEGTDQWTAPQCLEDRILCGELLGSYLPHFSYQLVRLHDYSNEELLAHKDEISLAMLWNKIQTMADVDDFIQLPDDRVSDMLDKTPKYLVDTLTKLLRALMYHMNVPEEKAERAIAKVKEQKMGQLWENAHIDICEYMVANAAIMAEERA
ncbi:MAG: Rpn family recombination-promoting nuclease/putative transposase, partial [Acetatifactor sp.]|nr:Rpn family recombination-promoting nuclease/putative transposase [Acetatifactor sp.]